MNLWPYHTDKSKGSKSSTGKRIAQTVKTHKTSAQPKSKTKREKKLLLSNIIPLSGPGLEHVYMQEAGKKRKKIPINEIVLIKWDWIQGIRLPEPIESKPFNCGLDEDERTEATTRRKKRRRNFFDYNLRYYIRAVTVKLGWRMKYIALVCRAIRLWKFSASIFLRLLASVAFFAFFVVCSSWHVTKIMNH